MEMLWILSKIAGKKGVIFWKDRVIVVFTLANFHIIWLKIRRFKIILYQWRKNRHLYIDRDQNFGINAKHLTLNFKNIDWIIGCDFSWKELGIEIDKW